MSAPRSLPACANETLRIDDRSARTERPHSAETSSSEVARVLDAIGTVADPCSIAAGAPVSLVDMGLIRSVELHQGVAHVTLRLTHPFCFQAPLMAEAIESRITSLGFRCHVEIDPRDDWSPELMTSRAKRRLRGRPASWGMARITS